MTAALIVLSAAFFVAALAAWALAAATARRADTDAAVDRDAEAERTLLEEEKLRALEELRDLEADHAMGKVGDEDYRIQRAPLEARALAAIRKLRALDERGTSDSDRPPDRASGGADSTPMRAIVAALALGSAALGAAPAQARTVDVDVLVAGDDGAVVPLAGAPVLFEVVETTPAMGGAKQSVVAHVAARSNSSGRVHIDLDALDEGRRTWRVRVLHGGAWWGADGSEGGTTTVVARELGGSVADLSFDVDVELDVRETGLGVRIDCTIRNASVRAVDLTTTPEPLWLPLVAPVAPGGVLRRGWLPEHAQGHMSTEIQPQRGRVVFERGAVGYRGIVLPGAATVVRLAYPLDYAGPTVNLGIAALSAPIHRLLWALSQPPQTVARLRPEQSSRTARVRNGDQRAAVYYWPGPVPKGAEARVTLGALPVEGAVRRSVAAVLAAVLGSLALLAVLHGAWLKTSGHTHDLA